IGRTGRAGKTGIAVTLVDWDELPRWTLINTALGLDTPDPSETYSSSPHLYEELHIPADANGTFGAPQKVSSKRPERKERTGSDEDKPRARTRNRRRTRGGGTGASGHVEQVGTDAPAPAASGDDQPTDGEGARRRRRRRPRKSSTTESTTTTDASVSAG
ncbi:MAG: helicase, superfamily, partial [Mycobacterium sp.]|nr:helicase, superfamily [Mycobacterium sp.]